MANERDPMTDDRNRDSMKGNMGERQGDSTERPGDESTERMGDESSTERLRGTGDDMEDEEFEETDDLDEDEEEEGDGSI